MSCALSVLASPRHRAIFAGLAVPALAVLLVSARVWQANETGPVRSEPGKGAAAVGEGDKFRKPASGLDYHDQTIVESRPTSSSLTPGFDTERIWSGRDDWEPAIAADPTRAMSTRSRPGCLRGAPRSGSGAPPTAARPGSRITARYRTTSTRPILRSRWTATAPFTLRSCTWAPHPDEVLRPRRHLDGRRPSAAGRSALRRSRAVGRLERRPGRVRRLQREP